MTQSADRGRLFASHLRRLGRHSRTAYEDVIRFLVVHGFNATSLKLFCGAQNDIIERIVTEEGLELKRTGRPPEQPEKDWLVDPFAHVWGSHFLRAVASLLDRYGAPYACGLVLRDAIAATDYQSGQWDTLSPQQRAIRIVHLLELFESRQVILRECPECTFAHLTFKFPVSLPRGKVSHGEHCPVCATLASVRAEAASVVAHAADTG